MTSAVVRIRGFALPDGDPVDLYADGDRWTTDPVPGADLVAEGWILPGLVDVHTHPGAHEIGDPLDEDVLRSDLRLHLQAGVTLLRAPGLAGDPPEWFGRDEELPRSVHAGRWLAQPGQFFDGWGRRADHADLPAIAAEQAARGGWAKIIGDWMPGEPVVPATVLAASVKAVHAVGGRLAVHTQLAEGSAAAVAAGVDSIEHGMSMDPDLLDEMARRGIALTPTLNVINAGLAVISDQPLTDRRKVYIAGASAHPRLVTAAVEAGVTVLAGTDSHPTGRIVDEIRAMAAAGVPAADALGAASWRARAFLGFGGLGDGAPADAVVYDEDPRADLGQLDTPRAVILRGRVRHRRTT
jgi:imidazolonepropionase-like amidohydrolase